MSDWLQSNRRLLMFIILSNVLLNFGFQVWQTLFNNFAVEELAAGPAAVGLIQAVREVPGLVGFVLGFLALFMSEIRIMGLSIIVLGAGMALTGQAHSVTFLLFTTLLMSVGFHFFYPSSSALVLMAMKKQDTPTVLGNLGSLGSIAAVAGTGLVYLLASRAGYRNLFVGVGGVIMVGGLLLLPFKDREKSIPPGRRVVLRRRYWLYYALSFLLGSRRHIFMTFAIFLLVREYHVTVQTTALLYLVNSLVNIYTLRLTGQLVGRVGERLALSVAFGSLALIFVGYAYVTVLPLLFGLFVLDNVFFGFNVGLTTYFQKIAVTQEEITSNLSVEQAINHVAAVVVPVVGGTVWELFGSRAPFLFGAGIVILGLILAQGIKTAAEPAVMAPAGS